MYTAHYRGAAHVAVVSVLVLMYFLPALIALIARRKNARAVMEFNFSLGWTIIGWVLSLVLACMPDESESQGSAPARRSLEVVRVSLDEGNETIGITPEKSTKRIADAFAAQRRRLIFEEGPDAT